jgi:hypothetical protein
MPISRIARICVALVFSVGVAAIVLDAAASPSNAITAAPQKITAAGVGKVKLRETYAKLRAQRLVGKIRKGCPLAGASARSAPLRAPLKGSVDFTTILRRRVADIVVRGGATARGVGIGATIAAIEAVYPRAKVDHSTDHMFGITLVRIPKKGGGKLQFAVSTKTHKVILIAIPFVPFCE